jgi:hypothetical protein
VNLRTALSIANLVAIVVAFIVLFGYPQYSTYAFYALLIWIGISFTMAYLRRSQPRPGASSSGGLSGTFGSSAGSSPLPSSASSGPRAPIDFCIFCGTTLPAGAKVCPACGHYIAPL